MISPPTTTQDALLELLAQLTGLLELKEFLPGLLRGLRQAVPADWISLNDLHPDPEHTTALVEPSLPAEVTSLFARHVHENPLVARYRATLDGRAYRFSDVSTPKELHDTALYQQVYAPLGLEHQIAFTLPHEPDHLLAIAISRRKHDFSDQERELLDRARPFLIQAYRNAVEHTHVLGELELRKRRSQLPLENPRLQAALANHRVTTREAEILSFVATGLPDRAIAELLGLSERTVETHLQRCYTKLNVHTRTQAVTLARTLATGTRRSRRG
jgi:DNA-binding CsgD family transcriptional regulator